MGMEIGNVVVTLQNKAHADDYLEIFDSVLRAKEESYSNMYEHINDMKEDIEYDNSENDSLEMTIDIYGLFDQPGSNCMEEVAKAFIRAFPDEDIMIMLYWSWDNCGDSATHTIRYSSDTKKLSVEEDAYDSFDDSFGNNDNDDDNDDDDEHWDTDELEKTIRFDVFQYQDGEFKLVKSLS